MSRILNPNAKEFIYEQKFNWSFIGNSNKSKLSTSIPWFRTMNNLNLNAGVPKLLTPETSHKSYPTTPTAQASHFQTTSSETTPPRTTSPPPRTTSPETTQPQTTSPKTPPPRTFETTSPETTPPQTASPKTPPPQNTFELVFPPTPETIPPRTPETTLLQTTSSKTVHLKVVPIKSSFQVKTIPIVVPSNYEGCLEEYVVLRLCSLMWYEPKNVRMLIGMDETNYRLKKHFYFILSMPKKFPNNFKLFSTDCFSFMHTCFGEKCLFKGGGSPTVFMNTQIYRGIFQWNIFFEYCASNSGALKIGIASSSAISRFTKRWIGEVEGSCSLAFFKAGKSKFVSSVWGVDDDNDYTNNNVGAADRSVVSVEVNANTRLLSFFIGGKKIPYAFSHIPIPLYVGISASRGQSFTSISLLRLPAVSPSPVECKVYKYKCEEILGRGFFC